MLLPLTEAVRRGIAGEIARSLRVARNATHPLAPLHRSVLNRVLLWRWTADAIDARTGRIVPDGFKHNCTGLHHSEAARRHWESAGRPRLVGGKVVVHEHVVPKRVLIVRLTAVADDDEAVFNLLKRLAMGAVITSQEHEALKTKGLESGMPVAWDGEDVWARYASAGIAVSPPLGDAERSAIPRQTPRRRADRGDRRAAHNRLQAELFAAFDRLGCTLDRNRNYVKVTFAGAAVHEATLENNGDLSVTAYIGASLPGGHPQPHGGRLCLRFKASELATWGDADAIATRICDAAIRPAGAPTRRS